MMPSAACKSISHLPSDQEETRFGLSNALGAIASAQREAAGALEETVGQLAEMTILQPSAKASRELIVLFQRFDRLQQEMAALSQLIETLGASGQCSCPPPVPGLERLIADVRLSELRERLFLYLKQNEGGVEEMEDVVF